MVEDNPAGTVIVEGTDTLAVPDESETIVPPDPAAPLRVTVPVAVAPPVTEAGEIERLLKVAGVIVKVAV